MQLLEALNWCLELGIDCVSVYAFSIENFNRNSQEVGMLMELAESKLNYLLSVRLLHSIFWQRKCFESVPKMGCLSIAVSCMFLLAALIF